MDSVIVRTVSELREVIKENRPEIIVVGELSEKLVKCQKLGNLSPVKIATLTTLLGAAAVTGPVTGGVSYAVAAQAAAATGVGAATIILASGISITLIISVFKGYDFELEATSIDRAPSVKLKTKKSHP
ncbi:MAG TPA: hypothetical protein GX712_07440 [Bacteroidales bacterium]|nr:hypothetical protein [Bacteroidales bacterium]